MGIFNSLQQSIGFLIPKPPVTEQNCPDQTGRVHVVTGGYGGVGLELAKILYQHNATLYLAGRSESKMTEAISNLQKEYPDSKGSVAAINVDFSDLKSIKPAADKFLAEQKSLHVLTLNHGVMFPPEGSKGAQGFDLTLATNCLGSWLFYHLLRPNLITSAQGTAPGTVRVTWASSMATDLMSQKPGGIKFNAAGEPDQTLNTKEMYGLSKAGNTLLASVLARKDAEHGVMHLSWNPGNLRSGLQRHLKGLEAKFVDAILYPARYGAYTELYAGVGDVPWEKNGAYIQPWGRVGVNRADVEKAKADSSKDGTAEKFVAWLEKTGGEYAQ